MTSRLPALGPRGEGWVAIQVFLFALIGLLGVRDGLAGWPARGPDVALAVGLLVMGLGALLVVAASIALGRGLSPFPRPRPSAGLTERGPYRWIRHPIYVGVSLGAVGWTLITLSPAAVLGTLSLVVLFDLKARREEAWLGESHPGYADYRTRTHRFIPGIY